MHTRTHDHGGIATPWTGSLKNTHDRGPRAAISSAHASRTQGCHTSAHGGLAVHLVHTHSHAMGATPSHASATTSRPRRHMLVRMQVGCGRRRDAAQSYMARAWPRARAEARRRRLSTSGVCSFGLDSTCLTWLNKTGLGSRKLTWVGFDSG